MMKKRIFSLILAVALCMSCLPTTAFAADEVQDKANDGGAVKEGRASETPYSVTIVGSNNGTVAADKTTAAQDETVTLTFTPDNGYEVGLVSVTANGGNVTTTAVENNQCTFIMPAGNVMVSATFSQKSTEPPTEYGLWVGDDEVKSDKLSGTGWSYDPDTQTLTLTNANISGDMFGIASNNDLKIVFSGVNNVSGAIMASDMASSRYYNLTISGTGSLTVTDDNPNGAIMAGSIMLGDGLQITTPGGGGKVQNESGMAYITDSSGNMAETVTLASSTPADTTNPAVLVNGVTIPLDGYLPSGATAASALTSTVPSGGYAHLYDDNGTLTLELKNASFVSGGLYLAGSGGEPAITIKLTGDNALTGTNHGLLDDYTIRTGTKITFTGIGSLTATGGSGETDVGIFGNDAIIVSDGATITANGGGYGIRAGAGVTSSGNVTASGGDYGIVTTVGNIAINGGTLTASGGTKALTPGAFPVGSVTCSVSPVWGGDNEGSATKVWDGTGALPDLTQYKYVQAGNPADTTPPTLIAGEVNRSSDTQATVKFTSSEAGEYSYHVVPSGSSGIVGTITTGICVAGENTITLTNLNQGAKDISIRVTDEAGNFSEWLTITIPAYEAPISTYTVTFHSNGGNGTMAAQTFTQGIAQSLAANIFTRPGHIFTGWNTQANGSGTAYSDGQSVTLTTEGMTLYAQWIQIPAAPAGLTKTNESVKGKADGKISAVDTTMEYSTDGGIVWKTVTGTEISGLAEGTVKVRVKAADSVPHGFETELTIVAGPAITVKFAGLEDCTNLPAEQTGLSYGAKAVAPITGNPVKSDYEFLGWYNGSGDTAAEWDFDTTLNDANIDLTNPNAPTVTIYARWKQVQFTVGGTVREYSEQGQGGFLSGIQLNLMQGNEPIDSTTSGENGVYTFRKHVPVGIYNIVAVDPNSEDHTKTDTILVTDRNIDDHIIMPPEGVNSHLDVGSGDLANKTVVGGLDDEALSLYNDPDNRGKKISVSMGVSDKTEAQAKGASDIKQKAKNDGVTTFKYLDIAVSATIGTNTQEIRNTANVMWIIVPFDFSNVKDGSIMVYRHHVKDDGTTDTTAFTGNASLNGSGSDGTFGIQQPAEGETEGYIHIYGQMFSTYAIGYKEKQSSNPGGNGGNGGGPSYDDDSGSSFQDENYDFWKEVREKIEDAKDGDTVKANAKWYDQMPVSVMKALMDNSGVTLIIDWHGGDQITIPAGKALIPEKGRIYYPLSYLEGIDFGALAANNDPSKLNPETGGDLYEITAPAVANAITTPAVEPEITDPRRGLAATIEDAEKGIEKVIPGVFEPVIETAEAKPVKNSGINGIWVLLAALAVGGGCFVWKKRKEQNEM